jgi:hypothetical protein
MDNSNFYTHLFLSSLSHPQLYQNREFILNLVKEKNIDVSNLFLQKINTPILNSWGKIEENYTISKELINKNVYELLIDCGLELKSEIYQLMAEKMIHQWHSIAQEKEQPIKDSLSMFEVCLKNPQFLLEKQKEKFPTPERPGLFYQLIQQGNLDLVEICIKNFDSLLKDELAREGIKFEIFKSLNIKNYDGKNLPRLIRILDENKLIKLDTKESKNLMLDKLFPKLEVNNFNKLRGLINSKIGKKYFNPNDIIDFFFDRVFNSIGRPSEGLMFEFSKAYQQITL